jgi:hypothetical protein
MGGEAGSAGGGTAGASAGSASTAGSGGASTAGSGGASTAGSGGASTAGSGGASTAGSGGTSAAGSGGAGSPPVCVAATDNGGVLDPRCVYLMGTLTPGTVGRAVLVAPRFPTAMLAGFYAASAVSVQSSGKVVFVDEASDRSRRLYSFVPDPFVSGAYPLGPLLNDTELTTPPCVFPDDDVNSALPVPGSSDVLYDCGNSRGTYYRTGQSEVWLTLPSYMENIRALNPQGAAWVSHSDGSSRILSQDGSSLAITGVGRVSAVRWTGTSWMAAAFSSDEADTRAAALYEISSTGAATKVADYVFSEITKSFFLLSGCVLEPSGALWCLGGRFDANVDADDVVLRMPPGEPSTVEYDEALGTVKIHGGGLFTGQ